MIIGLVAAASFAAASPNPPPVFGWASSPVDDAVLRTAYGKAGETTRLSAMVNEFGARQVQNASDLRIAVDNWFADSNLQLLANDALRDAG